MDMDNRLKALLGLELYADTTKYSICKAIDDVVNGYKKELSTIQDDELYKLILDSVNDKVKKKLVTLVEA
jgi:hypothetical protein